jgi:4-hydroxy-2-oxoheptanedioate aldolase
MVTKGDTRERRTSYGGWAGIPTPEVLEAMVRARCDWVALDLQHGAWDFRTAAQAIQLLDAFGVPSLIRISWLELHLVPRLLDFGAEGVIIAMVDGPELVERVVGATRYQPGGTRSYGGQRWGLRVLPHSDLELTPTVFAMIEMPAAIDRLDEIADVPGLTGLFLGEADLSLGLGIGLDARAHPTSRAAIDRMVQVAKERDLELGTTCRDGADALYWRGLGFNRIGVGSDIGLLSAALRENLAQAKGEITSDASAQGGGAFYGNTVSEVPTPPQVS